VHTEPNRSRRSHSPLARRRSASIVPPTVEPSLLTPAGMIQGYGNVFRPMRGASRRRRVAALAFAVLVVLPGLVVIIGFAMMIVHSI
jgi:hypothetical protein